MQFSRRPNFFWHAANASEQLLTNKLINPLIIFDYLIVKLIVAAALYGTIGKNRMGWDGMG